MLSKQNTQNQFQSSQFIGATASFYVTLLSGTMAPKSANQLSQTGRSLQIPFIYQGLGRTNNYIENLIASVPRNVFLLLFSLIRNMSGRRLFRILIFWLFLLQRMWMLVKVGY